MGRHLWKTLGLLAFLAPSVASAKRPAEPPPAKRTYEDFIGISPVGLLGFLRLNVGGYGLHYERVIAKHHGIWIGANAIHVHQAAKHSQLHLWTFGGEIAYRYYLGEGRGTFFGLGGGYKAGFGKRGEDDAPDRVNLMIRGWSIAPQLGHRWVLDRVPLSFVARASVGYAPYEVKARNNIPAAAEAVPYARDALSVVPLGIDLEFSIAYAF